jgi:hypothetical protein
LIGFEISVWTEDSEKSYKNYHIFDLKQWIPDKTKIVILRKCSVRDVLNFLLNFGFNLTDIECSKTIYNTKYCAKDHFCIIEFSLNGPRRLQDGSGSLYRKVMLSNVLTKRHLTETPFDWTPFDRTPFDRKVIWPKHHLTERRLTECRLTETPFDRIAV